MFNRHKHPSKPVQIDTLIGANTRIQGDIEFSGGLHLDGAVQGNVNAEKNSTSSLSISDSGKVQGSVNVNTVVLNGLVEGDIIAPTRVELGATAKVDGNVYYGLIEMAMGAQINGKLIHRTAAAETVVDATVIKPPPAPVDDTPKAELG
jgi:cytoskeletal protein CcmA (bactofilin family)